MKTIAVLTSGGDSPGMNAAIRAVVKVAAARSFRVVGVEQGYDGLVDGRFRDLTRAAAGGRLIPAPEIDAIGSLGGTVLGSARSPRFREPEGMAQASRHLEGVDGLIVIGGNGSLAGAHALSQRCQATKVIGIPASIDNDIGCTSTLTAWNPTSPDGKPTADPAVFRFPLQQVLSETERLIDGTSPVTRRRVQMMEMVEGVLPL